MALWELDEFQGPRFLGFVRNLPTPPGFLGERWLPNETTFDLEFEYILGAFRRPVMAHVIGWDSEAPLAGRPALGSKVSGELPPIKRKARISEKEIIRFMTPRAGTPDQQTAIDSVYSLAADLQDSVQARIEWLRMQALSEDKVVYNEGGVQFAFDFGIDDTFQIDMTTEQDGAGTSVSSSYSTAWTDLTNADPIADMTTLSNAIQAKTGFRPREVVMSNATLGLILNNAKVRSAIRGTGAPGAILTLNELAVLQSLYDLPQIVTYDVVVQAEDAAGVLSDVRPLATNKIFLVPGGASQIPGQATTTGTTGNPNFGRTLFGPTAESRVLLGTPLAAQAPGIYTATYHKDEPPSEWVKSVAVAFPSMPGANLLGQMKVSA
jgi:hypothetical protein